MYGLNTTPKKIRKEFQTMRKIINLYRNSTEEGIGIALNNSKTYLDLGEILKQIGGYTVSKIIQYGNDKHRNHGAKIDVEEPAFLPLATNKGEEKLSKLLSPDLNSFWIKKLGACTYLIEEKEGEYNTKAKAKVNFNMRNRRESKLKQILDNIKNIGQKERFVRLK